MKMIRAWNAGQAPGALEAEHLGGMYASPLGRREPVWAPVKLDELRQHMALERMTPEQLVGVPEPSKRRWRPLHDPEGEARMQAASTRAAMMEAELQRAAHARRAAVDLESARALDAAHRQQEATSARSRAFYDAVPGRYPGGGVDGY